ncbi:hypothetical protein M422DRAFT_252156 [Sphaerobolus stellatus SS14]|uniref:Uncharacterized protein n=1 Tax=Sphaerobolus stellatus (strain SS14) TaxID=990650 RepID=A0A0C9VQF7_SPHS4|nr:hypothetical protein M422DRAFT_252156 [Sphaerobolus stellatus SS14]
MAYASPILHHLLPACLIPAPRRLNLRKPDFIPCHRVPPRLAHTRHVAARVRRRRDALQSADGGRLGLSANGMYNLAPSNTPPAAANLSTEDQDLIRLWYAICTNETIIALSNGAIVDTPLTLQASLHRVIVGAMDERTLQSNGSIAGGTGRDGPIQSAQSIPRTREAMLQYVSKVFAFLSKLGE